ncbi:MAG: hypothetical protein PVH30_01620 [Desulfobacterales bacterium]|jgi:hypothetical protein
MQNRGNWPPKSTDAEAPVNETPDLLERRCPRLGGPVSFGYCRSLSDSSHPCRQIFDCWWERFDVVGHLRAILPETVFTALGARETLPRVNRIIELIEEARKARSRH